MRGMSVRNARVGGLGTSVTTQPATTVDRAGWFASSARRRSLIACAVLALLIGLAVRLALPAAQQTRGLVPAQPGASATDLSRLPSGARGPVSQSLGARSGAYLVRTGAPGLHASNPAQQLHTTFTARRGVLVGSAATQVGLDLNAIGYADSLQPVAPVAPSAHLNRVTYGHGSVSEWYVNGPAGLEQGFDIPRAPGGPSASPLTVRMAVSGNAQASLAADQQTVTFTHAASPSLRYSGMVVTDARGRTLPSWLELRPHQLLLRVNAVGARFPLQIDPFVQSGEKITATGESGSGAFGTSVAFSSSGRYLAVGAPADTSGAGAVWIFTRSGKTWVQTQKLTPKSGEETGAGHFGESVALSSTGKTLFVGAPEDNSGAGAAWVFAGKTSLAQEGAKLTAKSGEETGSGHFGTSVSLSGAGTTAIVGAPGSSSGTGAAWAFVAGSKKSPGWTQQGKAITPKGGEETGSGEFGTSVALESSAAGLALIGAPANNGGMGAGWFFHLSGSNWVQQGGKLLGGGESGSARFGESVALSGGAQSALVGGPGDELKDGAAWAFTNSEGSWIQQGSKLTPKAGEEVGGGAFGASVALASGGEAALVGADEDNLGAGAAWAFDRPLSTWEQVGEKLTGGGESGAGSFGASLALQSSADTGAKVIVGGPQDSTATGAVWAFNAPLPGVPVNTSPPTVDGAAQQGNTLEVAHGGWENTPTHYAEQWLRCNAAGNECEAIEGANDDSHLLEAPDVGHTLRVEETAFDHTGESEPAVSEHTGVVSALALSADAGESLSGCAGSPVTFDGSGSTPASEISKYEWEFGDSSSEEGAIVQHTYSSPGTYKGTLTVTRGGEHQSDSIEVAITNCGGAGKVTVHVLDSGHHPLSGVEVLYQSPGGGRVESLTEAAGEAKLAGVPTGTATLFAYKSGYRAATGRVTVDEAGEGSTTITLETGDVVSTEAKSHEMTLEEIERAGINPDAPENREVFEFEVVLPFGNNGSEAKITCRVNGAGQLLPPCAGESTEGHGGGGGGEEKLQGGGAEAGEPECTASGCVFQEPPGEGGGGRTIVIDPILPPEHTGGGGEEPTSPPALQYLILHGNASMLKQFVEVNMGIVNLSPEEPFELTHNKATLNLPAGLSLAPTPTPQSLSQTLGTIPPLGSASASWIIRGDEPGEYFLSAGYQGTLEPFEAEIDSLASVPSPFKVWGANALKLKVQADKGKFIQATPYKVRLGVEDVADIPLYNVELAVDENFHENFIFQPRQQFSEALGKLEPNHETTFVKHPYMLVPEETSVGEFRPELATASFVGEEKHPGEGIEAVEPPPLYQLNAPPTNEDNGLIRLTWVKKEPSNHEYGTPAGFEVYTTPNLQTPFGSTPVAARATPTGPSMEELPPTATEAYVQGKAGEPLYYAVSTVEEEEHFRLEMPLVLAAAQSAPEFGRCVAVAAGKGTFSSSKCTTAGGKKGYEWDPGAGKGGVTFSGGAVKLETPAKKVVSCKAAAGKGHVVASGLTGVSLAFTDCEKEHSACTSAGATAGEVRTSALSGLLAWEKKGKKAALDLSAAPHALFAGFTCASQAEELQGSVIVPIKSSKASTATALKFKESKGIQKPSEYETAEGVKVKDSLLIGGVSEAIGLSGTITLTSEEALEVNPDI